MKLFTGIFFAWLYVCSALGETTITNLPALDASAVGSSDVIPFVSLTSNETAKLQLGQLLQIPALQNPTFTGTVTAQGSPYGFVGSLDGSATAFSGQLGGDVTGTQSATTVSYVGGSTASSVNTAATAVAAATSSDTASTLVLRDSSGNFSGGTITVTGISGTNVVANSALAQMAAYTVKGNNTGSTANAADLSVAQLVTMFTGPTQQILITGSTYTLPTGALWIKVRLVGAGGGGGGSTSNGTAGGSTTFGTSFLTAAGGGGGNSLSSGGAGGTSSGGDINVTGGAGQNPVGDVIGNPYGATGGSSVLGGGGVGGVNGGGNGAPGNSYGGGGGGGGGNAGSIYGSGGGGGGGTLKR